MTLLKLRHSAAMRSGCSPENVFSMVHGTFWEVCKNTVIITMYYTQQEYQQVLQRYVFNYL